MSSDPSSTQLLPPSRDDYLNYRDYVIDYRLYYDAFLQCRRSFVSHGGLDSGSGLCGPILDPIKPPSERPRGTSANSPHVPQWDRDNPERPRTYVHQRRPRAGRNHRGSPRGDSSFIVDLARSSNQSDLPPTNYRWRFRDIPSPQTTLVNESKQLGQELMQADFERQVSTVSKTVLSEVLDSRSLAILENTGRLPKSLTTLKRLTMQIVRLRTQLWTSQSLSSDTVSGGFTSVGKFPTAFTQLKFGWARNCDLPLLSRK